MKTLSIKIIIISVFSMMSFLGELQAQKIPTYYRKDINVDSLITHTPNGIILLPQVNVYPKKVFANKKDEREWERLQRNFSKVYPVALEITKTYRQIDDSLARFSSDKMRVKYMKIREEQIMTYYKPKLIKFSLSQSILLVKLLDRETGSTAYEIIDELKGSVKAFFWQGFAKMFGNDLKKSYDSEVTDKDIELLVKRYKEQYQ